MDTHQAQSRRSSTQRLPRLILGLTGSVATIKVYELLEYLTQFLDVIVVYTKASKNFFNISDVQELLNTRLGASNICGMTSRVFCDDDEWHTQWKRGDPVLHIELRKWADMLLLAPLSANTLAKIANGLCDNLITSLVRAWDCTPRSDREQIEIWGSVRNTHAPVIRPIIACPAMNTQMYLHPLSVRHLSVAEELYSVRTNPTLAVQDVVADSEDTSLQSERTDSKEVDVLYTLWTTVDPQIKLLACGDFGVGAMASVADIVEAVRKRLDEPFAVPIIKSGHHVARGATQSAQARSSTQRVSNLWALGSGVAIGVALATSVFVLMARGIRR